MVLWLGELRPNESEKEAQDQRGARRSVAWPTRPSPVKHFSRCRRNEKELRITRL